MLTRKRKCYEISGKADKSRQAPWFSYRTHCRHAAMPTCRQVDLPPSRPAAKSTCRQVDLPPIRQPPDLGDALGPEARHLGAPTVQRPGPVVAEERGQRTFEGVGVGSVDPLDGIVSEGYFEGHRPHVARASLWQPDGELCDFTQLSTGRRGEPQGLPRCRQGTEPGQGAAGSSVRVERRPARATGTPASPSAHGPRPRSSAYRSLDAQRMSMQVHV